VFGKEVVVEAAEVVAAWSCPAVACIGRQVVVCLGAILDWRASFGRQAENEVGVRGNLFDNTRRAAMIISVGSKG